MSICTSVFTLVCASVPVHGLYGLDHCVHLSAQVSVGGGGGGAALYVSGEQQLISESAHYQTLMQRGRGRGGVRRRHLAHAVMQQWRLAELPPPLCQSIIILVFSQDSMSVPGPAMKFHSRSVRHHSEHALTCCKVDTVLPGIVMTHWTIF